MNERKVTFANQEDWEAWLGSNGQVVTAVWLRMAKKSAEPPTITYAQAVEGALCHGWIDGQKQTEGEHYWLQHPAGIREINRAKQGGT